jgi:hypothetical protein
MRMIGPVARTSALALAWVKDERAGESPRLVRDVAIFRVPLVIA